jgi:hypothetical protein
VDAVQRHNLQGPARTALLAAAGGRQGGLAWRGGAKCRHKLNALQHAVAEELPERYTQFAAAHESEHVHESDVPIGCA